VIGCRDYARIDLRTNRAGTPTILEVNPNPDYDPTAGLTRQLKAAGISHAEFTLQLVRQALARGPSSA
jgi:D-alanine-D-alanine ligase